MWEGNIFTGVCLFTGGGIPGPRCLPREGVGYLGSQVPYGRVFSEEGGYPGGGGYGRGQVSQREGAGIPEEEGGYARLYVSWDRYAHPFPRHGGGRACQGEGSIMGRKGWVCQREGAGIPEVGVGMPGCMYHGIGMPTLSPDLGEGGHGMLSCYH